MIVCLVYSYVGEEYGVEGQDGKGKERAVRSEKTLQSWGQTP